MDFCHIEKRMQEILLKISGKNDAQAKVKEEVQNATDGAEPGKIS